MTLIKSISGIRGTLGGKPNDTLSPLDIVKFTSAYATWVNQKYPQHKNTIIVGSDARPSRHMVGQIVMATLQAMGIHVIDLDLATTPTVEMYVTFSKAQGGIILTASHNPIEWNALKLLNEKGEFISAEEGENIVKLAEKDDFNYATVQEIGTYTRKNDALEQHINAILDLPLVKKELIEKANFSVVIDAVNSVGGIAIPQLLKALGVTKIKELHCTPNGYFPHNPEPLPEHLTEIAEEMKKQSYDIGIVVDPDVDRLALVCENGEMFGEEYTLVAIADYILQNQKGATVSNLSSTKALKDITEKYGQTYTAAAVGEVNVVKTMKSTQAVIGGEGNGGIIYPALHYGRDALVGVALFLSHLAQKNIKVSALREEYPHYAMSKNKITLSPDIEVDSILVAMKDKYKQQPINTEDGVKIHFENAWVHLRKSNTEPIVRIYSEAPSMQEAESLISQFKQDISLICEN